MATSNELITAAAIAKLRDDKGKLPMPADSIPPWAKRAISILADGHKESDVYKTLGIKRRDISELIVKNKEFAEAWGDVFQDQVDRLKESVMHRAIKGVKTGIYYQGIRMGYERKPSDALAMFMLKSLDPDTFGDKKTLNVHNKSITVQVRRFDENGVEIMPNQDDRPVNKRSEVEQHAAIATSAVDQVNALESIGTRTQMAEVASQEDLLSLEDLLGPEVMDDDELNDILGE